MQDNPRILLSGGHSFQHAGCYGTITESTGDAFRPSHMNHRADHRCGLILARPSPSSVTRKTACCQGFLAIPKASAVIMQVQHTIHATLQFSIMPIADDDDYYTRCRRRVRLGRKTFTKLTLRLEDWSLHIHQYLSRLVSPMHFASIAARSSTSTAACTMRRTAQCSTLQR